jgi:hypothetical protein
VQQMSEQNLESFQDFIDSLREVETLLAVAPADPLSNGGTEENTQLRDLSNAVTRACALMLVAHFEGFIKGSLTELIDAICQAKPPARRVPDGLLELHTRERIEEIFGTEGDDRIHRTRRLFTTYAQLWDDDRSINPRIISSKILTRKFTNAKPDILCSVFSLIGVDDLLEKVDKHVNYRLIERAHESERVDTSAKLIEIVDRRNKVAHGDKSEKFTPTEIEHYREFLEDVAECISGIIGDRISHCCSLI